MGKVYNWGMYPKIDAEQITLNNYSKIAELVTSADTIIPRGNGRCYGDSSLQKMIFSTLSLNKFISFDEVNGILHCEAGILLSEILDVILPKGYFLPVTPGTKLVTLGGAVASNVHGKNHHKEGAISLYIDALELLIETGEIMSCSKTNNKELFTSTIGGMGLTGIILSVKIQLKKIETSYIKQKSIKAKNIYEILAFFDKYKHYTYSVAWIDCLAKGENLGRSILMLGEHAKLNELDEEMAQYPYRMSKIKQINVPFVFPSFILNKTSIKLFNFFFYNKQLNHEVNNTIHYNPFFYPLDAINNWNRIYGINGFTQYQFAIPFKNGQEGLTKILTKIADSGCGSFLAVLKTFSSQDSNSSSISFPIEGYTLALDFKVNKKVFKLLETLDEIVLHYGGRLYLTKDARMKKDTFLKSYKNDFVHPAKFNSLQSQRLGI